MTQELRSQAGPGVRAFDQAGNVGDDEADFVRRLPDGDHAQVWLQCGERIVRNLRTCGRDARNQRGLPNIRIADQPDIRKQFQFEAQRPFFTGASVFMLARGMMS